MTGFLLFLAVDTAVMAYIIHRRGLFSVEGMGMALIALAFVTDGLGLLLI